METVTAFEDYYTLEKAYKQEKQKNYDLSKKMD